MVNFERNLNQTATYWAPQAQKDMFGEVSFEAPVSVAVRWEDQQEQIMDKSGRESISMSRIYSAVDFDLDGYLFLGISTETDPRIVNRAREIKQLSRIPDLHALKMLYVAYL